MGQSAARGRADPVDLPLALRALRLGGLRPRHDLAEQRRARDGAALARGRRDGRDGAPRRAVPVARALPVRAGSGLVDPGRRAGVRRREAPQRPADDVGGLSHLRARADGRVQAVGAVRRGGGGRDPGALLLVDPGGGAARLPVGDALRVPDREGVRATDPVVDRRRRARVAPRSPRSRAARGGARGIPDRGSRARGDEPSREAGVRALVALGLGRRRPAARRPRDRRQCGDLARLVRLAGRDAALQGPHARERALGRRCARGRGRGLPDDRGAGRARSVRAARSGPRSGAQSSRRWDR